MTAPTQHGGIFISYRREEPAAQSGRLFDNLSVRFGEDRVFMDVDSVGLGLDFHEVIQNAVFLLRGVARDNRQPKWLSVADASGNRRIDDPDDYVRLEIKAAPSRNVRVVPILLNDAPLPGVDELPPDLMSLSRRRAMKLDDATFRTGVGRLIEQLERDVPSEAIPPPAHPGQRPVPTKQDKSESSGARQDWSATLEEKKFAYWAVRLSLSSEEHLVEWDNTGWKWNQQLKVDGILVDKPGSPRKLAFKQFELTDGDATRRLKIDGSSFIRSPEQRYSYMWMTLS